MRCAARAAWPAVLWLGCLLSEKAAAADWSVAPTLSWTADTDSNRSLTPEGSASQSTALVTAIGFARATEATQLAFNSQLDWQFFDKRAYSDVFEDTLSASAAWTGDRSKLNLAAQDGDHSTLTTEATQTGILSSAIHQRMEQTSLSASYTESERASLLFDAGYTNSSYYGSADSGLLNLLEGYRDWTSSIAEQLELSEVSTLTVNANRVDVRTRVPGDSTTETGGGIAYHRPISESLTFDISLGETRVNVAGAGQNATTGSLNVTQGLSAGSLALNYSRSLSPYGTGTVAQRQQVSLSATHNLTEQLDLSLTFNRVQNGQLDVRREFGVAIPQVQTSSTLQLGLHWGFMETWSLSAELDATRTQIVGLSSVPVNEWRASVSLAWTPHRSSTSF